MDETRKLTLSEMDEVLQKLKKATDLTGELKALLKKVSSDAAREIIRRLRLDLQFDPGTERLQSLIDERTAFTLGEMEKSNYDGLREIMLEGIENGESVGQIAERIDEYTGAKFNTSPEAIARTELAGAQNMTAQEVFKQSGFTQKRWLTSRDGKVRPSHQAMEGVTVAIDEPFTVGSSLLMFPGDKSPYPEDWINCRCALVAA